MSQTGVISQEYQKMVELFRDINHSIIVLKKKHYRLPGAATLTSVDLLEANQVLTEVLDQITAQLQSGVGTSNGTSDLTELGVSYKGTIAHDTYEDTENTQDQHSKDAQDTHSLPPVVISRLLQRNIGTLSWYSADLQGLRDSLVHGMPLNENQVTKLDELCAELDAETTTLHRKLWKRER